MMNAPAPFYLISGPRETTIKVRRSVFTCRLAQVHTVEEAKQFISEISKANKNATHNCWAYIVGEKGEVSHSSDAGEPSGTAGKPMLNALQTHSLTQVVAVVTRFFGGVKLGVRGLIEAYEASVLSAIDKAPLQRLVHLAGFKVELAYDFNETFLARIKPYLNQISATDYTDKVVHTLDIETIYLDPVVQLFSQLQAQKKIKYYTTETG